jgi:hypothetical protein
MTLQLECCFILQLQLSCHAQGKSNDWAFRGKSTSVPEQGAGKGCAVLHISDIAAAVRCRNLRCGALEQESPAWYG